jgi:amino acid adenylation domain-containing protein
VPLDPASPAPRLARMLAAADPRIVIAGNPLPGGLKELLQGSGAPPEWRLGWISGASPEAGTLTPAFRRDDVASAPTRPVRGPGTEPVAHLLFTSGSTGVPKGVMVTHESVRAFVDWAVPYFDMRPGDRHSGHPPLYFDLSTFDIFGAIASGASLHPVPSDASLLPARLLAFMRDEALTQWFSVPSVFNFVAQHDALRDVELPHLRRVLWCGEVLPTPTLRYWMRCLPGRTWTNLYGPTEATIASSYYTVPEDPGDDRAAIPIGRACPGEALLVLDEHLGAVAPGEVGDLYLAGVGLSPGYWRDEDKTKAAFLVPERGPAAGLRIYRTGDLARVDEAGLVHFIGRADTQIKSRGYRIELGEIESALSSLVELKASAVVAVPVAGFEGWSICCAFVPADDTVDPAALRSTLARLLPSYMLPGRWLAVDELPRNANGKVDRPALRERFAAIAVGAGSAA